MKKNVKTARSRSLSSTLWLQRQFNDPYVLKAKQDGYRSRAAYKLLQLNEKFSLIKQGDKVVDLGAAPGGWSQVAAHYVGKNGKIVALDILPMEELPNIITVEMDFQAEEAPEHLQKLLNGKADVVISDMAAPTTGHAATDHLRIIALCELAFYFACDVLKPGGNFACKVFQGGTEQALLQEIKQRFRKVAHAKPAASRKESAETYLVALDFIG